MATNRQTLYERRNTSFLSPSWVKHSFGSSVDCQLWFSLKKLNVVWSKVCTKRAVQHNKDLAGSSIAVRSAPYYSSNREANPFHCSLNRISWSSGILQVSLRKENFAIDRCQFIYILWERNAAGVLPSPRNWGPVWNCSEARDNLSMDMDGLCSKPGYLVLLLGKTLWKVYSGVSLYTHKTIWRNCYKLPQLWSLLEGKCAKLRFLWESMKSFHP